MSTWVTEAWKSRGNEAATRFSLKVEKVLCHRFTEFQELWIGETSDFGRVMMLDGYIMLSERDEFVYHEMLSHVPLLSHPAPRDVLIIGGGDGGTLREVLRHSEVERVTLCEIDEAVVQASKEFLPSICEGSFVDPRADVQIGDGIAYVRNLPSEALDVIIVDSTDPVGPGELLFGEDFYAHCRRALRPDGIIALQSESPWEDSDLFRAIQVRIRNVFGDSHPYLVSIPTYPSGTWSLTVTSVDGTRPTKDRERAERISRGCRYYTPDVHSSAFALPAFVQQLLD
ncbi:MAG: spermidine synthase [Myxococcales bacterium]|nr:spermidine synthase [Myxococcales bacterium]